MGAADSISIADITSSLTIICDCLWPTTLTTESKGISRRRFVAGAAAGVAVGAVVGVTGGYLGAGNKTTTETSTQVSTTTAVSNVTTTLKPWLPASWDHTADVVVVGFGFAGQAAAIAAQAAGADVLVLEKTTEALSGGNSRVCGQCTWVPGTKQDGTTDSSLLAQEVEYFTAFGEGQGFPAPADYIQTAVTECAKNKTWLESLGATMVWSAFPQAFYPQLPGSSSQNGSWSVKTTQPYGGNWYFLKQYALSKGIDIMYSTPATGLVQNPETKEVLGVVATSNGNTVHIKANKGVVLCAGGYEYNPQMVRDYLNQPVISSIGSPSNTGDGIEMAIAAGADLWHMDVFAAPTGYAVTPSAYTSAISIDSPTKGGYIVVGADSKRFDDEFYPVSPKATPGLTLVAGKYLKHGVYQTPPYPMPMYVLFDQTAMASTSIFAGLAGLGWALNVEGYKPSADNSAELANGWIIKADTIADLAKATGLDTTVLPQTVTSWNAMCTAGADTDYGRTAQLVGLTTPPYYAIAVKPMILNTQGGPRRNAQAQILDTTGTPIPRLYAAGEMGEVFSWLYQCCRNVSLCYTMGRIAATNAAALTAWE